MWYLVKLFHVNANCTIQSCIIILIHYFLFQVLEDVSVDGIVKLIKDGTIKNIVTMAGAGISTCKFPKPHCNIQDNLSAILGLFSTLSSNHNAYLQTLCSCRVLNLDNDIVAVCLMQTLSFKERTISRQCRIYWL